MNDYLLPLLLDTNVLLLYLVARIQVKLIVSMKRLTSFEVGDHEVLGKLMVEYRSMITTPHVLAEVSNFVDQAPVLYRPALSASLAQFAVQHGEEYEPASQLVKQRAFESLGMTDTGLLSLSRRATILTTDGRLYS